MQIPAESKAQFWMVVASAGTMSQLTDYKSNRALIVVLIVCRRSLHLMGGNWTERERQQWQRRAERDREARGNRNIKQRACETSRLCIQRITEVEVFVPGGDFSPNQMHKDSVMGRRSFAVSLASDGPIPLDS